MQGTRQTPSRKFQPREADRPAPESSFADLQELISAEPQTSQARKAGLFLCPQEIEAARARCRGSGTAATLVTSTRSPRGAG
jgi:hypothetical protein